MREAAERRWALRRAALRRSVLEYWQGEAVVEGDCEGPGVAYRTERKAWG